MLAFSQDQTSLENLHDIVVPDPVPWWPPAPGWYILAAVLLATALLLFAMAIRHWWRNRYRGAAIVELNHLRSSVEKMGTHRTISGLDQLLKRVALAAWPRDQVAPLSGKKWIDFLNQYANFRGRETAFESEQTGALRDVAYSKRTCDELSHAQIQELFEVAELWIRRHKAPSEALLDQRQESRA